MTSTQFWLVAISLALGVAGFAGAIIANMRIDWIEKDAKK